MVVNLTVTIYGLIRGHRLVYLGQTVNLEVRLREHRRRIPHDSHVILSEVADDADWLSLESDWLTALRRLGVALPANRLFPKPVVRLARPSETQEQLQARIRAIRKLRETE